MNIRDFKKSLNKKEDRRQNRESKFAGYEKIIDNVEYLLNELKKLYIKIGEKEGKISEVDELDKRIEQLTSLVMPLIHKLDTFKSFCTKNNIGTPKKEEYKTRNMLELLSKDEKIVEDIRNILKDIKMLYIDKGPSRLNEMLKGAPHLKLNTELRKFYIIGFIKELGAIVSEINKARSGQEPTI